MVGYPPQGVVGVTKHTDLTDKEVAGVIDHADDSVTNAKVAADLDAGKIVSGRFPMARMPDGTDGYVLTAKGVGIDPEYAPISRDNILLAHQQYLGVFWFNNNWLPTGMINYWTSGSGSILWDSEYVRPSTGITTNSYAGVTKTARGLSDAASWDKKRYFGVLVRFPTFSAQNIHIVSGNSPFTGTPNTFRHIGFKLINADLYGTVANGTTESTLLLETLTAEVYRRLECILDPAIPECRFYVDGVDKGAITTNLPTGSDLAPLLFRAFVHNTETVDKILYVYEARTLQVE